MIIPIINNKIGIRQEYIPPYFIKDKTGEQLYYTPITGGIEDREDALKTAVRELEEEAGIRIKKYKLLHKIEDIATTKSVTNHSFVYILHITEYDTVLVKGDGNDYEKKSKTVWVSPIRFTDIILNKKKY